ncbi:hypothetical protein MMB75_05120 [Paenibacillus sp. P2(2022)]|uniref:hypothetical protein n=1 Tax=Paenibacillus sp. P2(2022) TaxID=2917813 RepID=UPI0024075229|nr:hypothetical protein [Paenibacillus sp. P2(2022)]MDG0053053.1 hypothetical protein [Paenibacillus sp. P2(2022)]
MLDMTDQQINVALAELTGFPADKLTPNYCNDAAASLEVQAKALMTAGKEYTMCLTKILTDSFEIEVPENDPYWIATLVLTATPRQRAEAAYMTLSSQC